MEEKKKERNKYTYHRIPYTYYVTLFIIIQFISRAINSTKLYLPLCKKSMLLSIVVTFLSI